MERLVSPNGVEVEAMDEAVGNLLAMGFSRAEAEKPKPKAAPRKRADARTKEQ